MSGRVKITGIHKHPVWCAEERGPHLRVRFDVEGQGTRTFAFTSDQIEALFEPPGTITPGEGARILRPEDLASVATSFESVSRLMIVKDAENPKTPAVAFVGKRADRERLFAGSTVFVMSRPVADAFDTIIKGSVTVLFNDCSEHEHHDHG